MLPVSSHQILGWALAMVLAAASSVCSQTPVEKGAGSPRAVSARYEFRDDHDPDGIGKFYLGREIARVMGHQGADWLERPERDKEEEPDRLIAALPLRAGDNVADIGAGTGYHTRRLAERVGSRGEVYAVDIQPEMLALLDRNMAAHGLTNYVKVLSTEQDPRLPAQRLDLALLVDVYHEFSHPLETMDGIVRALKDGGRVVLVEFRAEDPKVPIKALHKMSEAQVKREMAEHGLVWVETIGTLPWQHAIVFRKPGK